MRIVTQTNAWDRESCLRVLMMGTCLGWENNMKDLIIVGLILLLGYVSIQLARERMDRRPEVHVHMQMVLPEPEIYNVDKPEKFTRI